MKCLLCVFFLSAAALAMPDGVLRLESGDDTCLKEIVLSETPTGFDLSGPTGLIESFENLNRGKICRRGSADGRVLGRKVCEKTTYKVRLSKDVLVRKLCDTDLALLPCNLNNHVVELVGYDDTLVIYQWDRYPEKIESTCTYKKELK